MIETPALQPVTGPSALLPDRPQWSAVAVTGFVLSFLLILAPIGSLLGIIGIFKTKGGRRRGFGLAVAAIPIGLIVGGGTLLVGAGAYAMGKAILTGRQATSIFKVSSVEVSKQAGPSYDRFSKRFQVVVSQDRFAEYISQVIADHGSLQELERMGHYEPTTDGQGFVIHFTGRFVNGPADIAVTIGFDGFSPEVDNIEVEGKSPKDKTTETTESG